MNFQNLPYEARKMFVAGEGKLFVAFDLSQAEPRLLSHITQDPHMLEAYRTGKDLYSTLASKVYGKPIEECGDGTPERKAMKKVLLALMYGMTSQTLAEDLNMEVEEADKLMEDFFTNYPTIKNHIEELEELRNKQGYIETWVGSKRRWLGIQQLARNYKVMESKIKKCCGGKMPKNLWTEKKIPYQLKQDFWKYAKPYNRINRQTLNSEIQGGSAMQVKKIQIALDKLCKEKGWNTVISIHDEIVVIVPETITKEDLKEFENVMLNTVRFSVPNKCDGEVFRRWGSPAKLNDFINRGLDCFDEKGFFKEEE